MEPMTRTKGEIKREKRRCCCARALLLVHICAHGFDPNTATLSETVIGVSLGVCDGRQVPRLLLDSSLLAVAALVLCCCGV